MTTANLPAGMNHDGTEHLAPEVLRRAIADWRAAGSPVLPVTLDDGSRDWPVIGQVLGIADTAEGLSVTMALDPPPGTLGG